MLSFIPVYALTTIYKPQHPSEHLNQPDTTALAQSSAEGFWQGYLYCNQWQTGGMLGNLLKSIIILPILVTLSHTLSFCPQGPGWHLDLRSPMRWKCFLNFTWSWYIITYICYLHTYLHTHVIPYCNLNSNLKEDILRNVGVFYIYFFCICSSQ